LLCCVVAAAAAALLLLLLLLQLVHEFRVALLIGRRLCLTAESSSVAISMKHGMQYRDEDGALATMEVDLLFPGEARSVIRLIQTWWDAQVQFMGSACMRSNDRCFDVDINMLCLLGSEQQDASAAPRCYQLNLVRFSLVPCLYALGELGRITPVCLSYVKMLLLCLQGGKPSSREAKLAHAASKPSNRAMPTQFGTNMMMLYYWQSKCLTALVDIK
jgi:hypothetical protein